MSGPYDLGSAIPPADITLQLTDQYGNPAPATGTPVLTVTLPDQTTATPAVATPAAGTYQLAAPYVPGQAGHYLWAWTWSGVLVAATETVDSFEVRLAPDPTIVSLAEAKNILRQPTTDNDQEIRGYSQAITEWVEHVAGPVVTRQFTASLRAQGNVLVLPKAPVRTDLGTALSPANRRDGSTTNGLVSILPQLSYSFMYPIDELLTDPRSGLVRHLAGLPFFYSGDPYGQYLATWWAGRKVIPWGIYEASKIALKHVWAVERGGMGQPPAFGESETTQTGYGFAVPNRAIELLTPHSGSSSRAVFA